MDDQLIKATISRRAEVAAHHVAKISFRQQEVLALEYFGFELADVAKLLAVAESTVRNHLSAGRLAVVPPALVSTRGNATFWISLHWACCMGWAAGHLGSEPKVGVKDQ